MSVGLGVGTVRYSAGAGIGTAVLSPAVRHTSGALTLDFAGSLASLPGGAWAGQGLTGLSLVTPPLLRAVRFSVDLTLAGTGRSDSRSAPGAHGRAGFSRSLPPWGPGGGGGPSRRAL